MNIIVIVFILFLAVLFLLIGLTIKNAKKSEKMTINVFRTGSKIKTEIKLENLTKDQKTVLLELIRFELKGISSAFQVATRETND